MITMDAYTVVITTENMPQEIVLFYDNDKDEWVKEATNGCYIFSKEEADAIRNREAVFGSVVVKGVVTLDE